MRGRRFLTSASPVGRLNRAGRGTYSPRENASKRCRLAGHRLAEAVTAAVAGCGNPHDGHVRADVETLFPYSEHGSSAIVAARLGTPTVNQRRRETVDQVEFERGDPNSILGIERVDVAATCRIVENGIPLWVSATSIRDVIARTTRQGYRRECAPDVPEFLALGEGIDPGERRPTLSACTPLVSE
jgi:hypothetical protein